MPEKASYEELEFYTVHVQHENRLLRGCVFAELLAIAALPLMLVSELIIHHGTH